MNSVKWQNTKSTYPNGLCFCTPQTKHLKKKNPIHSSIQNKILRNKSNPGSESYKSLMKEIEEDANKWKALPCLWANIKMPVLPIAIYRFPEAQGLKVSSCAHDQWIHAQALFFPPSMILSSTMCRHDSVLAGLASSPSLKCAQFIYIPGLPQRLCLLPGTPFPQIIAESHCP